MTIYIIYHNVRNTIPQWNYIPDSNRMPQWDKPAEEFDMTLVDSMPNTDAVYATIDQIPPHSNWLYPIPDLYDNAVYTDNSYGIFNHFMSVPRLIDDLLAGYGRIIFDARREGYLYSNYINGQLRQFFESYSIPLDKVIFATGAINACDIFKLNDYKFAPLCMQQFELEACKLAHDSPATIDKVPYKRFLCFNRRYAYRLHRLQFLSLIYQHNLLPFFYYSMLDGVDNISVVDAAKQLVNHEPAHFNTYNTMLELSSKMPMILDTDDIETNLATTHYMSTVEAFYNNSAISVIVETLFNDNEVFFSEKTWHPIRMLQPFILVGGAGSLKYLKQLGYKTFDQWWDESYDSIANPNDRLEAIVSIIKQISNWSEFQLSLFLTESKEICNHNLIHLKTANTRISYNLAQLFS